MQLFGNYVKIDHINVKCLCENCNKEIGAGHNHLIVNINFKYYGSSTKYYNEKKKKTAIGTVRLHFECFEKITKELINVNEKIEKLKIDLFAKVL